MKSGILVLWFGFLVKSSRLPECFLTKTTSMIKDIKDSYLCVLSHNTCLQSAKLSCWKKTVKKGRWRWKHLHRIKGLGTNFWLFFSSVQDWSKQWLIIPVSTLSRTRLNGRMAVLSSPSWATPVSDMAGGCGSDLAAPCITFKWFSLFQVDVQFFRFLSL